MAIDGAHDSIPPGAGPTEAADGRPLARLFVSGDSATSVIALAALRTVMAGIPAHVVPEVVVIDVIQEQMLAFDHQVYVTPHLTVTVTVTAEGGGEVTSTMGDGLTDREKVSAFLERILGL